MKNTLLDLNNHLFAQLERLGEEDLKGDELKEEISRSKAVTNIAKEIIANGQLVLDAKRLQNEYSCGQDKEKLPPMLTGDKENV